MSDIQFIVSVHQDLGQALQMARDFFVKNFSRQDDKVKVVNSQIIIVAQPPKIHGQPPVLINQVVLTLFSEEIIIPLQAVEMKAIKE